ncbi:MAG: hypothetical protein MI975_22965 [Cytophagales bacterium]|nr:hypothetical protein [Cytophagales bacterium]
MINNVIFNQYLFFYQTHPLVRNLVPHRSQKRFPIRKRHKSCGSYFRLRGRLQFKIPTLESFSGPGISYSIGSGLSTGGTFKGFTRNGTTVLWRGSFEGFSLGLPELDASGGGIQIETNLLFPKKNDEP